jgi:hypothetical protein
MSGLTLVVVSMVANPAGANGQSVSRVRVEENVRVEPQGSILARVFPGTMLGVVDRQGSWVQVDLEGWVWARSLQESERAGFDLRVSAAQGENLRDAPSGEVLGRLASGMLLEELDRRPGWIHVRRRAWIWAASVVETSSTTSEASAPPIARRPGGFVSAGEAGAAILTAPDGDTLARTVPRAELAVTAREGNWARVRLEGWTWLPAVPEGDPASAEAPALEPADLLEAPDAHRGRVVSWEVQFISLERAESVRTDFFEGEPFLLARFGGAEGVFVYIAVAPDRVQEVQGLVPLERIAITARVRTGSSSLTATPIVDLIDLERVR